MLDKGYRNTRIQEVLTALKVPKGSFYHYFDSKETFAVEVMRHFDRTYSAKNMRTLRNPNKTPIQRLIGGDILGAPIQIRMMPT